MIKLDRRKPKTGFGGLSPGHVPLGDDDMKIAVIDGNGGRIGKMLTERIKAVLPGHPVLALGTNGLATAAMLKGGADRGATGINPIVFNAPRVDIIMGPTGIVFANALLGEITPEIAAAVGSSPAFKILIPIHRCNHHFAGLDRSRSLSQIVDQAVEDAKLYISDPSCFVDLF